MERLGLKPQYGSTSPATNITLHDFENALASMTALLYWAAGNVQPDYWAPQILGYNASQFTRVSQVKSTALVSRPEMQLNINVFSLALGSGTSAILLVTIFVLLRRLPGGNEARVGSTGILHSMWLAYNRLQLQNQFLQVVEPTTNNLRTMGMVEVQLADEWPSSISGSNASVYCSVSHPVPPGAVE